MYNKSWIFPSSGRPILTGNSTSTVDALGCLDWQGSWSLLDEKKIFQAQSDVKTNQRLSKGAGMKTGLLLLPQSAILSTPKTNSSQSYFAEISQSQKCLVAAPTGADESHQNKNTPWTKVRLWLCKSKTIVCCMLQPRPQKDKSWRVRTRFFFFPFLHWL